MRRPRSRNVRSHRFKRRRIFAPWLVATTVTAVVAAILSTGFYFLVRTDCTGHLTATVVASPSTAPILESLARDWAGGQPAVRGRCAGVDVESQDTTAALEALAQQWSTKAAGTPPDVWVPESAMWAQVASANPTVAKWLPPHPPSLARSVEVIAMPRPMAEALGWPKTNLTWQSLINDIAAAPDGWGRYGKPWGPVRLGMTDPTKSTSALLALVSISDANDAGQASDAGRAAIARLRQTRAVYTDTWADINAAFSDADRQGGDAVLRYLSAVPALETDVLAYNRPDPNIPLVGIYPSDGSADADQPYYVLRAPWSAPDRQAVASAFLRYITGSHGRDAFREAGFRDAQRRAGDDMTESNGVVPKVATAPRVSIPPAAVQQLLSAWTS